MNQGIGDMVKLMQGFRCEKYTAVSYSELRESEGAKSEQERKKEKRGQRTSLGNEAAMRELRVWCAS